MNLLKPVIIASLVVTLGATSGCVVYGPEEEQIDPATAVVIPAAPVGPRPSVEPRGGGGSGGW